MGRRLRWSLAAAVVLAGSTSYAVLHGYESLANWKDLPRAKTGVTAGLASSYDRTGGSADFSNYLWPAGLQTQDTPTVVADLAGPGILTRFWMPHATANEGFATRVIVDGIVRIDTTSNVLLGGGVSYMADPLVQTLLGGQVSYEPIAFQRSVRIESNNFGLGGATRICHYYQWAWHELAADAVVTPYNGELTDEQRLARQAVTAMIQNVGANPAGPSSTAECMMTEAQVLGPGEAIVLADLHGGGTIRQLSLKVPDGLADRQLDCLRLRVRYDNQPGWAIDVPVSHFFGAGHGRVAYRSLPMGTDSPDGYYSYWPMPFRQAAAIELSNETWSAFPLVSAKVEYEPGPPPADAGYLHAFYRDTLTDYGQQYHVLLDVRGQGHYVGNLLYVEKDGDSGSILEGDDIIRVNPGTPREKILYGTGTEDAYNGGYYYNHGFVQTDHGDIPRPRSGIGPYHGLLYMDCWDLPGFARTRTDQYRWMIGDYVPFTDGITVQMEVFQGERNVSYGSTAFYYLANCPGDINGDGYINVADLSLLVASWGRKEGDAGFSADADLSHDGFINVGDLQVLVVYWGGMTVGGG